MKRYLISSLKYLLAWIIIFCLITFASNVGNEMLSYQDKLALFMANNGAMKLALFVVLALIYPLFGFVKRDVRGSVEAHRDQIIVAMESSGFSLKGESNGKMIFKANTLFRQITTLFDGYIEVSQSGDMIHIEGIRRGVIYATYYLEGFIKRANEQS